MCRRLKKALPMFKSNKKNYVSSCSVIKEYSCLLSHETIVPVLMYIYSQLVYIRLFDVQRVNNMHVQNGLREEIVRTNNSGIIKYF